MSDSEEDEALLKDLSNLLGFAPGSNAPMANTAAGFTVLVEDLAKLKASSRSLQRQLILVEIGLILIAVLVIALAWL